MSSNIPTIDISTGLDTPAVIDQIGLACEDWGFFQITGHGIDTELRREFFLAMATFFDLPQASKWLVSRTEENFWGYYDKELTKNQLDCKEIFDIDANLDNLLKADAHSNSGDSVPWPTELPQLQSIVVKWLQACEALSQNLLGAICVALGEASEVLNPFFMKKHTSFLRFNYYPTDPDQYSAENDETIASLGIHSHTDAGALTVLAQDCVPGLQVRKGDTWHSVIPEQNSFIINIGDMVQVWSNDRFTAPQHRVLASSHQPRYSAPYFYNPSYETICSPLVETDESSKYKPISWHEFRRGRAAGDYADVGEEIQISWYRK